MSRHHRITIPRPKPDFQFNLPDIKLPTLYEIRVPRGGIGYLK